MKLSGRDAAQFCRKPDLTKVGVLIYGEDGVEVAQRRRRLVLSIVGDGGDADMRLRRMPAAEARRSPAEVMDAVLARGFFIGRPVVVVEDAGDGVTDGIAGVLEEATADDAFLVVTAGALPSKSRLRKLFEGAMNAVSAPVYAETPGRAEIEDLLRAEGAGAVSEEAIGDLAALGSGLDSGALRDLAARLALHGPLEGAVIGAAEVALCAPGAAEADLDDAVSAALDGNAGAVGPVIARLRAQGQTPTGLAIATARGLRQMHGVLAAAGGGGRAEAAIAALRPPVFGPNRDALARRCRVWTLGAVEGALKLALETDDALRGEAGAAGWAILERALLRIALSKRS